MLADADDLGYRLILGISLGVAALVALEVGEPFFRGSVYAEALVRIPHLNAK